MIDPQGQVIARMDPLKFVTTQLAKWQHLLEEV